MPSSASVLAKRSEISAETAAVGQASTQPLAKRPPAVSMMSCAARWLTQSQQFGSQPRSKRYDASVLMPNRLAVARMFCG